MVSVVVVSSLICYVIGDAMRSDYEMTLVLPPGLAHPD